VLKSGDDHLRGLRDGRIVYVGSERVDDVTAHPAFKNGARSIAAIYDMKRSNEHTDAMSFEEDGERFSMWYLKPKTREDLSRRMGAHKKLADLTNGLLGRSPDHVASFVTGLAMKPDVFDKIGPNYGGNLLAYYKYMRANDIYSAYAVLPPAGARNPELYEKQNRPVPTLRVVKEDDKGVTINGMKMLATGAVFADELWIGNLIPLAPHLKKESITCAVPCGAPGVALWSRKPFAKDATSEFDYPLSYRLDETDSMVLCRNVFVPWEKVFVHDNADAARTIYIDTPSHCLGNHQSNVRFWAKMQLLVGLASRICQSSGNDQIPAVRETLGRLAALEATIAGLVYGQIQACESWPPGYVTFNRRIMYAALNWCTENHSHIIDTVRELTGGSVFQMPADVSVMHDDKLREEFETYWSTPFMEPLDRFRLFRLAWDLVGSEFAGRHIQYEKFYAGASFVVRNHSWREADWAEFHRVVDTVLERMQVPPKPASK